MNVLCQKCNETKATVHITDSYPEKRERHLCDECAAKEGVIFKPSPETTTEILQQFIKHKVGMAKVDDRTCPECGISFQDFQSRGLLGCPNDYSVFAEFLKPIIEQSHEGATHHTGKVPINADDSLRRQTGLRKLRRELQDAIDQEDYEAAARLRDEIKAMETV